MHASAMHQEEPRVNNARAPSAAPKKQDMLQKPDGPGLQ